MRNNTIDLVPEMVTIKTAAERTGLSYDFLWKLCRQGKIVHIKAGAKYYINFGRLIDYLNTGDGRPENEEETDDE